MMITSNNRLTITDYCTQQQIYSLRMPFPELLEEKSGGTMVVDVHSDAELGNDVDTVQQVQAYLSYQ